MTLTEKHTIEKALCHLFLCTWLSEQAQETGLVRRQRKVNPISLFWTLVLSFGIGKQGDLVSLRRSYENATGMTLAASSFYDRFTGSLFVFLQQACQRALHYIMETSRPAMRDTLSAFHDILITDATFCVCMICSKAHIPPVNQPHPSCGQTAYGFLRVGPKRAAHPISLRPQARVQGLEARGLD